MLTIVKPGFLEPFSAGELEALRRRGRLNQLETVFATLMLIAFYGTFLYGILTGVRI